MRRRTATVATVVVLVVALTGCASGAAGRTRPGLLDVVASTSAWGSIAAAVGGREVVVNSVISDPGQDPHSFEASARTLLEIKDADLLIENGGGYDDFMTAMISAAHTSAPVLDAVEISGHRGSASAPLNEHVWYDVAAAEKMTLAIADVLSRVRPAHAAEFTANATRLTRSLARLARAERGVAALYGKTGVAVTEPVPLFMLEAMRLRDLTPPEFSAAVEEGSDVSTRTLEQTLQLFDSHEVGLLVYNEQTSGPVTEHVISAAQTAGIPVVAVTETLPLGMTYVQWMRHNIDAIRSALAR